MATKITTVSQLDSNDLISIFTAALTAESGFTFESDGKGMEKQRSISNTVFVTIITTVPSTTITNSSKGFVTVATTVPSTTMTIRNPTSTTTLRDVTAEALSIITSYMSIGATVTDPIEKSILLSTINRLSSVFSLTSGDYTNLITISPSEQSYISQQDKKLKQIEAPYIALGAVVCVALFLLAVWALAIYIVRKRLRLNAKNFPPLVHHVTPDLGDLSGLMAEMGRSNTAPQNGNQATSLHRVPSVSKTQNDLHQVELPDGIAELPASGPDIELLQGHAELSGGEVTDLEEVGYEMRGRGLRIRRKPVAGCERESKSDDI